MQKKSNNVIYIFVSVILIVVAIASTAVINRLRSPNDGVVDVRARAGITSSLRFTGVVSSVDEAKGVINVDSLQFATGESASSILGVWTVTPQPGFVLSSVGPGTKISIVAEPTTFLINSHTVTATQITISK